MSSDDDYSWEMGLENQNINENDELDTQTQTAVSEHVPHSDNPNQGQGSNSQGIGASNEKEAPNAFQCPSTILKKYAKGPFDPKKPLLQFVTNLDKGKKVLGGTRKWLCHICNTEFKGSYTRVECHLTDTPGSGVRGCKRMTRMEIDETSKIRQNGRIQALEAGQQPQTPMEVSSSASITRSKRAGLEMPSSKQPLGKKSANIHDMFNIKDKEEADDSIAEFFYAHGLPLHIARSPYFKNMFQKTAKAGPSYVPPGDHRLRTTLLDKQFSKCSLTMEQMRSTWISKGCSIVMDGWTDIRHRPLINIIVTCAAGPYFLRAVDCSGKMKDAEFQYLLLRDAINEVGASNVVQVITDSAPVCQRAGHMVEQAFKHIFWTPCCVHALNNALKDIGKIAWIKQIVVDARDVQMFVCNHHTSLALFRAHSKKEFIKPGDTRYATYFILLERMLEIQEPLQTMVVTAEWRKWSESKTEEGKRVKNKILDDSWWTQARYIVSFITPMFDVIRYADTDSPSLGEIYETFDSMLGEMKKIIAKKEPEMHLYETYIRPIIQKRWDKMNTPLHMAAYAINPKWYAAKPGRVPPNEDNEVRSGFLQAIRKMFSREEAAIYRDEWVAFINLSGPHFSTHDCLHDRADLAQRKPLGWWQLYGMDAPNLCNLAVRLLSQVASSSAAERNWSTYGFIHSVRRNRLTSRRAEKLVAVHSSLRLRQRCTPQYRQSPASRWDVDPEDPNQIDEDEQEQQQQGLVGVALDGLDDVSEHDDSDGEFDLPGSSSGGTLPHVP